MPRVEYTPAVQEMFREYGRTRDPQLLERLLSVYEVFVRGLAYSIARRTGSLDLLDDMENRGRLKLMGKIQTFDPERGIQFETYAYRRVRGAMLDLAEKENEYPVVTVSSLGDETGFDILSIIPSGDETGEFAGFWEALKAAIDRSPRLLPYKNGRRQAKRVMELLYRDGLDAEEAGEVLDLTGERIHQIHRQVIAHRNVRSALQVFLPTESNGNYFARRLKRRA